MLRYQTNRCQQQRWGIFDSDLFVQHIPEMVEYTETRGGHIKTKNFVLIKAFLNRFCFVVEHIIVLKRKYCFDVNVLQQ